MTDNVRLTLAKWRAGGHVWGVSDCMLSIGDYLASRGYRDVTGLFRGTYDDEAGALAHIERAGGCAALVDLTGAPRVPLDGYSAGRGDVVIVETGSAGVGAICTGDMYAMRLDRGVVEVNRRLVRISALWRVGNGEDR